jgi:NADPH:quinone reductase-like Zn-dependent oxidoreductase
MERRALKPPSLDALEAASAPVIAVTAWQMLFEYAQADAGDTVMIVGAAGNVGAYAVRMAINAGIQVVAVARAGDTEMLRRLGAGSVIDSTAPDFEKYLPQVDAILDTVGGATLDRCVNSLKPGGRLVSVVSAQPLTQHKDTQAIFFYAEVTTARLRTLAALFESGGISARVGSVLPLAEARQAHEMLGGAAHLTGKIVLRVS